MNIQFLKYRKIYFIFSGILILLSLTCLTVFGLKMGIEFTGGSILEIDYQENRPSTDVVKEKLAGFDLNLSSIQTSGEQGLILRMKDISEQTHQEIMAELKQDTELTEKRFETIGPMIGQELKQKTKVVVILSLLVIVLYIAFAFRKISQPVQSWQYGIASLMALFHDILIPLGVFSLLGQFYGVQITIPVITAFLAVLGYSINNTVVVFDRVRENLLKIRTGTYEENVNQALNQTLTRSINTSLTTLFVLLAIFFFGGVTLKFFALALILGITAGTYSSLFLASPVLVTWLNWKRSRA